MTNNTSQLLDELSSYLSTALSSNVIKLIKRGGDGRIDSQENERQISHALELYSISNKWQETKQLKLEVGPARFWYDFIIKGESDIMIPVNVKVSTLRTSDNLSSKEGLFYALTGINPLSVQINNWESFCKVLAENLGSKPESDYFFLVINKNEPGDVFWTSLKRIHELVPNGNNPPFQCNWSRNRNQSTRNEESAQIYILDILRKTFELRAKALVSFNTHLLPLMRS